VCRSVSDILSLLAVGAVGGMFLLRRLVVEVNCRLLAVARVVVQCWRTWRKSWLSAGRLRSAVRQGLEAVAASSCSSGSLGDAVRPSHFAPRRGVWAAAATSTNCSPASRWHATSAAPEVISFDSLGSPNASQRWLGFASRAVSATRGSDRGVVGEGFGPNWRLLRPTYVSVVGEFRLADGGRSRVEAYDAEWTLL
jgi:hypothetical protein